MYMVCWCSDGINRWADCESRNDVAALLTREGIRDDESVRIFSPEACEEAMSPEDIFAGI